jgi:putative transcriptional regulator
MHRGDDIRALRERFGCTQPEFADRFGIPVGTLRNWEQDRYVPDPVGQLLLCLIARYPKLVALEVNLMKAAP